jgi:hypothetical protein
MSKLLAQVVPLAVGAALSPTMVIITVVTLTSQSRARVRATAFVAGGAAVLVAIAVAIQLGMGTRLHGARHSGLRVRLTSCSACCSSPSASAP